MHYWDEAEQNVQRYTMNKIGSTDKTTSYKCTQWTFQSGASVLSLVWWQKTSHLSFLHLTISLSITSLYRTHHLSHFAIPITHTTS